jgi:EmrB/QacA subfamily drug resistance transporter
MAESLTGEPKLRSLILAAALAIFAINLDFFAVQAALPATAADFNTTTTALQWVISGYMLALASFLIVGGRLADLLGRRTWLFIGAGIFAGASMLGGLATSPEMLIGARIVQGAGAAVLMPVSVAVVTNGFPKAQTQRAVGMVFGIAAIGQALGPLIGGGLTQVLNWRWVLFINLPIALLVFAFARTSVVQSRDETASRSIDWSGLCLIVASVAVFTIGINQGASWGWLSPLTLGCIFLGVLGFGAFALVERSRKQPLVDLQLFRIREFTVMILAGAVGNVGATAIIFVAVIYLQTVEGLSPLVSGLALIAFSGGVTLAAQLSGRLERFKSWAVMDLAMLLGGLGAIGMGLNVGNLELFLAFSVPAGAGLGLCWSFASVVTQAVVPAEKAGAASGVVLTVLIGLGGVGIAIASAIIVTHTTGQTDEVLSKVLGYEMIGVGVIALLFVPVVALLGRRSPAGT